jgi:hypothetical protein
MAASVTLEKTGLEQMFEFYGTVKQKTLPEVLRIHARLACVELARRTQPFGDKAGGEKVGEKAITRDLLGRGGGIKGKNRAGLFAHITPRQILYADSYDTADITVFATKNGDIYGVDRAHFLPDAGVSDIRNIHRSNFVNGKMSAAGGDTHNIGRWKFINKYFVPKQNLAGFAKLQYAKVGIAKSGWAWCAKQLKTGKGSATRGIPRWVTRHLGDYGLGIVQDLAEDSANPRIVLTNTCKYADKVCPPAQQQEAVLVVVNKMVKQLANMLRYERKQMKAAA